MLDVSDPNFLYALIIRGPIISCCRWDGVISELLWISSCSSYKSANENSSIKYVKNSKLVFAFVILEIELYTYKLVNPTIQLESRPTWTDGLNEEVFLGLISLNSSVSRGFVWVWWITIWHFFS